MSASRLPAPDDLVHRSPRLTPDEVQRAPDLFLAVKRAVDLAPVPGQFILTGSFNLLLKRRFRVARDLTPDR